MAVTCRFADMQIPLGNTLAVSMGFNFNDRREIALFWPLARLRELGIYPTV